MTARVTIDKRWHQYALDGERVASVTTVLNGVLAKPALAPAAARETAAYAATHAHELEERGAEAWKAEVQSAYRRTWDVSRDEGTAVHKIAESLIYGKPLPDVDEKGEPWSSSVFAMAQQLARWFDRFDVEPIIHEAIVFHETHRWAGTLDLLADLNTGDRWLLDYKTSASGVWQETALQLAAYKHATHVQIGERVQLMAPVDRVGVVWVRPDEFQLVPVVADGVAYGYFLHALALYPFTKVDRGQLVLPPVIPTREDADV